MAIHFIFLFYLNCKVRPQVLKVINYQIFWTTFKKLGFGEHCFLVQINFEGNSTIFSNRTKLKNCI